MIRSVRRSLVFLAFLLVGLLYFPSSVALAASGESLGNQLPMWSVIPFAGILLSIALFPLLAPHFWEHNMGKVSLFWSIAFFVPFLMGYGFDRAVYQLLHIYVIDYIPFIILLTGLFAISGGITVRGSLTGTPLLNTTILAIGSVLASIIGTTGASMLLLRPLIRALACRRNKAHTIVFFIFIVSNIGGSLTPIGDPPLFLGFLHGVTFFWTLKLLPLFLLNVSVLLVVYFVLDSYLLRRERGSLLAASSRRHQPISIAGMNNFILLAGVIGAIVLSGTFAKHPFFFDAAAGHDRGIPLFAIDGHMLVMPLMNVFRDGIILLLAWFSMRSTPIRLRKENNFTWNPIKEVAILFAGIFATIIPAIAILQARGGELGVTSAAQFFWASGALSSFLDNAPTYLTFLSLAGGLGLNAGVWTDLGFVTPEVLMAISAGSVFMGANTYIGNAPNFMVRSIAEENEIKMPSFFGYMAWSGCVLIPLFILDTLIFFMK
ncbi:sodium:proton antiporter [Anaerosporomusa subterranea]|uniref:Sodium:proton antiporter n=1 Tax=Anaerosporomusa subterranea TaxID=1794912 RepID=A0A154BQH1_ANASB|nr:sodium:proton antiporter [Anaerosporomusa subterranea]KYZ76207.1 sodium:proton antiporter [Anaerosporomusa subterranea]